MSLFVGDKHKLATHLSEIAGSFYVYELCRPDGQVFYVGKGTKRRVLEHELEARRAHPIGESNPIKCNVIRKILREGGQVLYKIDSIYHLDDELACLRREAELIQRYRRLHEGGTLTNLAGGIGNMSGAAPMSVAKHAATLSGDPEDNPERATLNRFLRGIGPVGSVPIKPVRQMGRILPTTPHPSPRKPTARCAYALVASASAHGLVIQPNISIPRIFTYEGVNGIVENGVSRDIIKAEMAVLIPNEDPREECYELNAQQCGILIGLLGREMLITRGLL